jgi:hypothetical protein
MMYVEHLPTLPLKKFDLSLELQYSYGNDVLDRMIRGMIARYLSIVTNQF